MRAREAQNTTTQCYITVLDTYFTHNYMHYQTQLFLPPRQDKNCARQVKVTSVAPGKLVQIIPLATDHLQSCFFKLFLITKHHYNKDTHPA